MCYGAVMGCLGLPSQCRRRADKQQGEEEAASRPGVSEARLKCPPLQFMVRLPNCGLAGRWFLCRGIVDIASLDILNLKALTKVKNKDGNLHSVCMRELILCLEGSYRD